MWFHGSSFSISENQEALLESESLGILVTYLLPLCIHDVYIDGGMTSNGLGLDVADTMVTE